MDFLGPPAEFDRASRFGFLGGGRHLRFTKISRGTGVEISTPSSDALSRCHQMHRIERRPFKIERRPFKFRQINQKPVGRPPKKSKKNLPSRRSALKR